MLLHIDPSILPDFSFNGRLPLELDGERLDVGDAEVSDLERGRQHGALKGTAPRHSLVQVQRGAQFSLEYVCEDLLDGGNSGGPSNQFNGIDIGEI